jgi:hypothetical protein
MADRGRKAFPVSSHLLDDVGVRESGDGDGATEPWNM